MNRKVGFCTLTACAVGALLLVVAGWAGASNMGFKLNFGIINAVNKLLWGSGVSLSATADNDQTTMVVNLDLAHRPPVNSNMGFKLNVISLPLEGIVVVGPDHYSYTLKWDGTNFGFAQ